MLVLELLFTAPAREMHSVDFCYKQEDASYIANSLTLYVLDLEQLDGPWTILLTMFLKAQPACCGSCRLAVSI